MDRAETAARSRPRNEVRSLKPESPDIEWMKKMKLKVEEEVSRKEMEAIEYWKGEVEKIVAKRQTSLAALQFEIQNLVQRMQNRIKILKNALAHN
jgi:hypothetical protein